MKLATLQRPRSTDHLEAGGPADPQPPAAVKRRITGWRVWAVRLVLMIAAPVALLAVLEGGLRLFGYGRPTGFFVSAGSPGKLTCNEEFVWRFSPRETASEPSPFSISAAKPQRTVRIFVLGGSAAWGTPDPSFNFGRILEVMLRRRYPDVRFEVVNAAIMGVNSHVVLPIIRDCARRDPDLFIVYLGNNEVIGMFGPGPESGNAAPASLSMIRAGLWAKSTRLGQLVGSLLSKEDREDGEATVQDEAFFLAHRVAADDPRRTTVCDNFRGNLEDICDVAGHGKVPMVLATVAVNLKDNPPFGSLHRADLTAAEKDRWEAGYRRGTTAEADRRHEEAIAHYLAAAAVDDRFAELHFRLAGCHFALGQFDRAREHYVLARDLDALQFRADGRINRIIREVAAVKRAQGIELVDVERAAAAAETATHGIPGETLFYEHVHLRFAGNYLLAKTMFPAVVAALGDVLGDAKVAEAGVATQRECADLLGFTKCHEWMLAVPMAGLTSRPPFTLQFDHVQRQRRAENELERLSLSLRPYDHRLAIETALAAVERAGDDWQLRNNAAGLLYRCGDYAAAADHWIEALEAIPHHAAIRLLLGHALTKAGRKDEALAAYDEVARSQPDREVAWEAQGYAALIRGRFDEAIGHFDEALKRMPHDADAKVGLAMAQSAAEGKPIRLTAHVRPDGTHRPTSVSPEAAAHFQRGNALGKRGEFAKAVSEYRQAIRLCPHEPSFHNNLAAALLQRGETDEAAAHLSKALELDPDYGKAHALLGQVCARQQKTAAAIHHFRRAIELKVSSPRVLRQLAWLLATAVDLQLRDGDAAVDLAERACRETGHRTPDFLDTLAAAYAEAGRFDDAAQTATKAQQLRQKRGHH